MMTPGIKIAPSILGADFGGLMADIKRVEQFSDFLHMDIMDGHFVPNISFGPGVVRSLKDRISLPFDVHLMVDRPQDWIDEFAEIGPDWIVFHMEAAVHADRLVDSIHQKGIKAGIALNPATPEAVLEYVFSKLDMVLVMTVNPGFGGQSLITGVLPKIRAIREKANKLNPDLDIAVDGGINEKTAATVVDAGANVLIMGSAAFKAKDPGVLIQNIRANKNMA